MKKTTKRRGGCFAIFALLTTKGEVSGNNKQAILLPRPSQWHHIIKFSYITTTTHYFPKWLYFFCSPTSLRKKTKGSPFTWTCNSYHLISLASLLAEWLGRFLSNCHRTGRTRDWQEYRPSKVLLPHFRQSLKPSLTNPFVLDNLSLLPCREYSLLGIFSVSLQSHFFPSFTWRKAGLSSYPPWVSCWMLCGPGPGCGIGLVDL